MSKPDFYKTMGVRSQATQYEIKKAFRRLVKKFHPDVSKDPDAEERMKEINGAYEILNDSDKRRQYDSENEIIEPPPVRRKKEKRTSKQRQSDPPQPDPQQPDPPQYDYPPEPPRYNPPRYEYPPEPAKSQPYNRSMHYAAGWIIFILILIFMWVGSTLATADNPQVVIPVSPVVQETPTPQPVPVGKTFEDWKSEGDALIKQQRNGDALVAYDRALEIRPDASELWVVEGDIYSTMGNFEKAITSYDQALKANPQVGEQIQKKSTILKNADSLMERAELLVDQENYSAAIAIYDDILSAGIRNTNFEKWVLSSKVFALMRSGDLDEATRVSKLIESV